MAAAVRTVSAKCGEDVRMLSVLSVDDEPVSNARVIADEAGLRGIIGQLRPQLIDACA
jgi:hypothetical protein